MSGEYREVKAQVVALLEKQFGERVSRTMINHLDRLMIHQGDEFVRLLQKWLAAS